VTGVVLAFTLMLMPQAAIAQSIAIAAMPTFSAQYALGKLSEMRLALANSIRGALVLSIPASLGLILLRTPIVSLLYQRGAFDENSTRLVAWALMWYAAGLVGHAIVEILSRAFYALHDTKTPVLIGIITMSLNVGFSYFFSAIFLNIGWLAHGGLALANSVATGLEAIGLLYLMRKRLGGLEGRYILMGTIKSLIAAFIMGIGLMIWINSTQHLGAWAIALGGIVLGGLIFLMMSFLFRIREVRVGLEYLRNRIPFLR
jgi:putative peptidoglycan lipid II flippase